MTLKKHVVACLAVALIATMTNVSFGTLIGQYHLDESFNSTIPSTVFDASAALKRQDRLGQCKYTNSTCPRSCFGQFGLWHSLQF